MKLNLSIDIDRQRFQEYSKKVLDRCCLVELREVRKQRTYSQNRYLHLILSVFALEMGETLEYVKQDVFKKIVNPDIFKQEYYNKKGEYRIHWKSTMDLDTSEMTKACLLYTSPSPRD